MMNASIHRLPLLAILTSMIVVGGALSAAEEDAHRSGDAAKSDAQVIIIDEEVAKRFGIATKPVELIALVEPIHAPGTAQFDPDSTVHVGSVVTGRVSQVHVRVGDAVKPGDPLIALDSPELGLAQNDWLQKRAAIAVSEAEVQLAEQAATRAQTLVKDNGIASGEAQRRQGELAKAKAEMGAARAAATAAENTLHIYGMDQAAVDALGKTGEVSPQVILRAAITGVVIARDAPLVVLRPRTTPEHQAASR